MPLVAGPATLPSFSPPTVLAVSCPPELVARCAKALGPMGLAVQECGFLVAATTAAERRPLVIVMVDDIYAFDPEEFDALARDVQASLVRVEEDIPVATLQLLLGAAVDDAAARRSELLPAWDSAELENGRRTVPNPTMLAYNVGQRLPSRADLAAAAWPSGGSVPPPSRPG
jgi:hypothetical protein